MQQQQQQEGRVSSGSVMQETMKTGRRAMGCPAAPQQLWTLT
jgi:hypothetical protein